MQQEKDCDYFATRKMGRQLLKSPYDTTWWNSSKYRLCLHRFDPLPPDARVLDLGCGLGQTAYFLAEVSGEVTGIDLSAFAIRFAMENYERPNLRFVQADIFVYEPEVLADAVFLRFSETRWAALCACSHRTKRCRNKKAGEV
jgi:SAM-dependent methyltransferase